jgi:hypothetical protein
LLPSHAISPEFVFYIPTPEEQRVRRITWIFEIIPILIFSEIIAGCGLSPEKHVSTSTALTATVAINTSTPPQISLPKVTTTPVPEPTTTPISIATFEDMEGVWFRTYRGAEFKLTINKDGGVTHIEVYFPQDVRIPDIWFEDGLLYVRETTPTCSRDQVGTYEVTGTPGEYLIFTPVDDPCAVYRNFRGKWTVVSTQ